jgi:hypothetical protein
VVEENLSFSDTNSLIALFSINEIKKALWAMDDDSSLGPDRCGLNFSKKKWELVKNDILMLLNSRLSAFHPHTRATLD